VLAKAEALPHTPIYPEFTLLMSEMCELVVYHKKTPKEAVEWAAEEVQKVMDEYWMFR